MKKKKILRLRVLVAAVLVAFMSCASAWSQSRQLDSNQEARLRPILEAALLAKQAGIEGDFVMIVRKEPGAGRVSLTRTIMSYPDFLFEFGRAQSRTEKNGSAVIQGEDFGESSIPTSPPPPSDSGFNPGDRIIFFREGFVYDDYMRRTTEYEYLGGPGSGDDWLIRRNDLISLECNEDLTDCEPKPQPNVGF